MTPPKRPESGEDYHKRRQADVAKLLRTAQVKYRGFIITVKQDFGYSPLLINGLPCMWGYISRSASADHKELPGATWTQTVKDMKHALDVWLEVGEDPPMFWERMQGKTDVREVPPPPVDRLPPAPPPTIINTPRTAAIVNRLAPPAKFLYGQRVVVGDEIGWVSHPPKGQDERPGYKWVYLPSRSFASEFVLSNIQPLPNGEL